MERGALGIFLVSFFIIFPSQNTERMKQQQAEENRAWTTRQKGENTPRTLLTGYKGALAEGAPTHCSSVRLGHAGPAPPVSSAPTVGMGPLLASE